MFFVATFWGVGLLMPEFDFITPWNKALHEREALLESIETRLPPDGQVWLNGLNRFCRRVVEFDLRNAGPDQFVEHWKSLRDILEGLEREFGPSDAGNS